MSAARRVAPPVINGLATVLAAVTALSLAGEVCRAQPLADAPRFRRVYAPIEQIHLWPFQNERYIPIAGREFEELAKKAQAAAASAVAPTLEQIVECRLTAAYDGDGQLTGTAEFVIRHDAESMQAVRLAPLSPAVTNVRWLPGNEPAAFGTSAEGDPTVLVERSGTLAFDWKLRTVRDASEGVLLPVDVPVCAATTLTLRLPAVYDVQRGDYIVEGPIATTPAAPPAASPNANTATPATAGGINTWIVRSAGGRMKLRLAKRKDPALTGQQNLVRHEVAYEFSERGVEVTAQLRIDALQSPLDKIELSFDPELTLVDARFPDRRLSWITTPAASGQRRKTVIEFDRPLQGANRTLFLKAVAPLVVGRRVALPIVRTPGLFWQQAVFTLSVPSPLQLVRIDPRDAVFTSPVPLAGNRTGEAIDVQCFTPDASVDILLERMDRPVRATGLTMLRIFDEEIAAESRSEVRIDFGDRFNLTAEVPAKWIIDSVATTPATAMQDWALSDSQQGKRTLSLRFAQPLSPDRPLRIAIAGRLKQHAGGDVFTRDDLRFVEFKGVDNRDPIAAIRGENALRLLLQQEDESTALIAAAKLDPLRKEMLGTFKADYLLDLRPTAENWRIDVEPRTLRLLADAHVEVVVDESRIAERYELQLRNPEKLPLRRVRVRIEPAKSGSIEWSLGDERRGQITAERVTPATAAPAGGSRVTAALADAELWDITFRRPPTGDVVLRGSRTGPWKEAIGISLASVDDAATQTGTVVIAAPATLPLEVKNRTLKPQPVDVAGALGGPDLKVAGDDPAVADPSAAAATGDAPALLRSAFRYDPAHTDDDPAAALALVRATDGAPIPRAIVWELRYHSDYVADRRLAHRALLFLQACAPGQVKLSVPDRYRLESIRVEGREIRPDTATTAQIPLPAELGPLTAEVVFTTSDFAAGSLKLIEMAQLSVDVPVLRTTRDMTLPLAYDAPTDASLKSLDARGRDSTLRKLLGPLVTPKAIDAFDQPLVLGEFGSRRTTIAVDPLVRALGEIAAERMRRGEAPAWVDLCEEADRRRPFEQAPLRFNVPALAREGILASTPVATPIIIDADPSSFGERLLNESGLTIAQDRDGLVLTTDSNTAYERENGLRVFALPTAEAAAPAELPVSASVWRTIPESAWKNVDDSAPVIADIPPGQDYVLAASPTTRGLWVIRREIPPTIAFAVVVTAFVVGRSWAAKRRRFLLPVITITAAAALALPDWIGVFATSALIGFMAGLVVAQILPARARQRATGLGVAVEPLAAHSRSRASTARTALPLAIVGATTLIFAANTAAQVIVPPTTTPTTTSAPVAPGDAASGGAAASTAPAPALANPLRRAVPIFIPADADGKPTGERYQVPERLLQELQASAERSDVSKPTGALLRKAEYSVTLARDAEQTRLVVSEVRAVIELTVLQAPAQVTIPFGVPGDVSPVSGLADGRLIDVRRSANGQSFTYEALEAGPSRLELSFKPSPKSAPPESGAVLAVPRINDAALKIYLPAPLPSFSVAQAADALTWSEDKRQGTVALVPTDKLSLQWTEALLGASGGSAIDRLTWLKVRPGSVVVDFRMVIRPPAGGLKEVFLSADPRLQWLPKHSPNSLVADVEQTPITAGQTTVGQRIEVKFTRPIVKEERVEVSFLLTGSTSVGKLRIPDLRLADDLPGLKLFAVSVDPLLTSSVAAGSGTKSIAVPEFIKAWGPEIVLPQSAYERIGAEIDWALTVRPKPAKTSVRQIETLTVGRRQIDVVLEADVDVQDGLIYHHELQAPQNLEVESITVAEAGDESVGQAGRFARDDKGTLLLFLRAPLGGKHRLTLRGRIVPPAGGEMPLPLITLGKVPPAERIVRIARLPEVLVAVEKLVDIVPQKIDNAEPTSVAARIAAVLKLEGKKPTGLLKITENPHVATARLVSTYRPDGSNWQYELDVLIDVEQGLVDDVGLELPPQVATPVAIVPSMPYEVITSRESTKRRLLIRPRQAIDGRFEFTVRAGLVDLERDAPLPYAVLRRISGVTHFFRLPKHAGTSPIRWETAQLSPVEQVAASPRPSPAEQFDTYRVAGSNPQAVLRTVRGGTGRPYVRLAEHRVLRSGDGTYVGTSTFLVEPAGAGDDVLHLPSGAELLAVTAGGGAVTPVAAEGGAWRVPFASDQMPHWIEVLYRRSSDIAAPTFGLSATLAAPHWEHLRAERTLWTVSAESAAANVRIDDINGTTVERTLMERLTALDEVGLDLIADGSSSARDWLAPILRQRTFVRRELAERLDVEQSETLRRVWRDALEASDKRFAGLGPQLAAAASGTHTRDDLTRLWNSSSFAARGATCAVFRGEAAQLDVRADDWNGIALRQLLLLPAICLAAGFCVWVFLRADGAFRFPQLYGVLAGIAWILLLRPEIVGWIILLAMAGCRFHPSLRRVRERTLKLGQGSVLSRNL